MDFHAYLLIFLVTVVATTAKSSRLNATATSAVVYPSCDSFQACRLLNLQYAQDLIKEYRCKYIEESVPDATKRKIHFLHIPKAGGTSIDQYLQQPHMVSRYDHSRHPHENYGSAEFNTNRTRLFAVLFRHPASKAISLFNYMKTHKGALQSPHWKYTYNSSVNLLLWSKEPMIIEWLSQNGMFRTELKNAAINAEPQIRKQMYEQKVANGKAKFSVKPIKDKFPVSENEFTEHIEKMIPNPEYQCLARMKTALLLIKRFSAVSTLEEPLADFWHVLSARAGLDMTTAMITSASGKHLNKSKKFATEEEEEEAFQTFSETFRCDVIVWKIADMISKQDLVCPMVLHEERKRAVMDAKESLLSSADSENKESH